MIIKTCFTSKVLSSISGVKHGFFTKNMPISTNTYILKPGEVANNLGLRTQVIRRNRTIAMEQFGLRGTNLSIVRQVHGNKATVVMKVPEIGAEPEADGQVTNEQGVGIGIMTADCVPVLLADTKTKIIGCAHAGWRGAVGGILENVVKEMVKLGSDPMNIVAAIGPCIRQDSYEVGEDLYEEFIQESTENNKFFNKGNKEGKYMFNLPGYVKEKLLLLGVNEVEDLGLDTYSDKTNFISYRRAKQDNLEYSTSLISVIMISANLI